MALREAGLLQQEIADQLNINVRTVQRVEAAFKREGEEGLKRKPGSGRPRAIAENPY